MSGKKRGIAVRLWWCCSLAVFLVCAAFVALYLVQSAENKQEMAELTAYVMGAEPTATVATNVSATLPDATVTPEPAFLPTTPAGTDIQSTSAPTSTSLLTEDEALLQRYQALAEQNPDFIGWLTIEATNINDPVMYTPNDSQHYLHRDFSGNYSTSGQLFMDAICDLESAPGNKIIYGHNMRDGSRFADLKLYLEADFMAEHPHIQFDTLYERGTYEVMAAFRIQVESTSASSMFCYRNIDTTSEDMLAQLSWYLDRYAKTRASGVQPKSGDELLTLSTCGRVGSNERVVVMARRIQGSK